MSNPSCLVSALCAKKFSRTLSPMTKFCIFQRCGKQSQSTWFTFAKITLEVYSCRWLTARIFARHSDSQLRPSALARAPTACSWTRKTLTSTQSNKSRKQLWSYKSLSSSRSLNPKMEHILFFSSIQVSTSNFTSRPSALQVTSLKYELTTKLKTP